VRHGESDWNAKNLFTGWADVGLSEKGVLEGQTAGQRLKEAGFEFDLAYTSLLKRAIDTLDLCIGEMGLHWIPVGYLLQSFPVYHREYYFVLLVSRVIVFLLYPPTHPPFR